MNNFICLKDNYIRKKSIGLIHKIFILSRRNNQRYVSHCKTKSEVRGGGKKPWKQKGTGRARAGSIRSPLWVGGGKSFGPRKRIVKKKINKKERKLAILVLFFFKSSKLKIIPNPNSSNFLKKNIKNIFRENLIKTTKKILIILDNYDSNLWKYFRNNKNIELIKPNYLNLKSLLLTTEIFLTKTSITKLKNKFIYEIN